MHAYFYINSISINMNAHYKNVINAAAQAMTICTNGSTKSQMFLLSIMSIIVDIWEKDEIILL